MKVGTAVPTKASTAKAVSAYIAAHTKGDTIGGGALYTALFLLLQVAKGNTLDIDGQFITVFSGGKLAGSAKVGQSQVICQLVDPAGKSLFTGPKDKVEQALAWAKLGTVPAKVEPLYLTSPKARKAVAAGTLPEGWAPKA